jgi:hypothetical protein
MNPWLLYWGTLAGNAAPTVKIPEHLPEAEGVVPLPAADVVIRIGRKGVIHLDGSDVSFAGTEAASAELAAAIRERVPTPAPTSRARLYIDEDSPAMASRMVFLALGECGLNAWDLAAAPDGELGLIIDIPPPTPMPSLRELLAAGFPPSRFPLTLHLRTDGVWVGRDVARGLNLALPSGPARDAALEKLLDLDRTLHPGARNAVVVVDDPVPFGEGFSVLAAIGSGSSRPSMRAKGANVPSNGGIANRAA